MTFSSSSPSLSEDVILDHVLALYTSVTDPSEIQIDITSKHGTPNALLGILQEVWQTVLPRKLIFQTSINDILALEVTDRQIFNVASSIGRWTIGIEGLVRACTGQLNVEVQTIDLHSLLTRFCELSEIITVTHQKVSKAGFGTKGISTKSLSLLEPNVPAAQPTLILRFLDGLGDIPTALLMTDRDDQLDAYGDITSLERLRLVLKAEDEAAFLIQDQMIILSMGSALSHDRQTESLLFGQTKQTQIICSFNTQDVWRVAELWIAAKRHTDQPVLP